LIVAARDVLQRLWEIEARGASFSTTESGVAITPPHGMLTRGDRAFLLAPPDLFLHNHARETYPELNPDLPVNPNCASCLDAEGWMAMVASAEARFQSMLTER
jgi:hypothetical protein